jgi:hypothetical protein
MSAYPQKRTLVERSAMSALCQKRTFEGCGLGVLTGPVASPCWLRARNAHGGAIRLQSSPVRVICCNLAGLIAG